MRVWILSACALLAACSGGTEPDQGARLLVVPGVDTLPADSSEQFRAILVRGSGDTVNLPDAVWSSRDPDVASVSPTGLVTGIRSGEVTIVALAGDLRGTAPIRVERRFKAKDVATGSASLCAVDLDERIWCTAGYGTGSVWPSPEPGDIRAFIAPVEGPERYRLVGTNTFFACGLDTGGQVHCWGYNYLGDAASAGVPMAVDAGRVYDTLSVQGWAACGLSEQTAHCWGVPYDSVRTVTFGGGQLVRIAVGEFEACGYTAEGNGQCWDEYSYGYATRVGALPAVPAPLSAVRSAPPLHGGVTGAGFYCGLDAGESAWCWGSNDQGQLGNGTMLDSDQAVPVAGGLRFMLLSAAVGGGIHRVCGIATDQTLYCWGQGYGTVPSAILY